MPLTIDERLSCLKLATEALDTPEEVVKRAGVYATFLEGVARAEAAPALAAALPPAKKTRAPKAVEQDALLDQLDAPLGGNDKPSKGASFEDVKTMTLRLRDTVDGAAVRRALDHFQAKTIQDLKDSQWTAYVQACTKAIANHKPTAPATDDFGV